MTDNRIEPLIQWLSRSLGITLGIPEHTGSYPNNGGRYIIPFSTSRVSDAPNSKFSNIYQGHLLCTMFGTKLDLYEIDLTTYTFNKMNHKYKMEYSRLQFFTDKAKQGYTHPYDPPKNPITKTMPASTFHHTY